MRRYGLIGFPLGHSFSQAWFTRMFAENGIGDCVYENFPLESIGELPALIARRPDLYGLNVTIPYKEAVIPYLDEIDPQAAAIGAVNCVKIIRKEDTVRLKGYNADAWGFERSLLGMIGAGRPDALVLGTGGASKAVAHVLDKLGIAFRLVSRRANGEILSYDDLTPATIGQTPLIVNTTPLGMSPHVEAFPDIPYEAIGKSHFLYDLIYNPAETAFLHKGRTRGATVMNGYSMLTGQAEKSWDIWNGE